MLQPVNFDCFSNEIDFLSSNKTLTLSTIIKQLESEKSKVSNLLVTLINSNLKTFINLAQNLVGLEESIENTKKEINRNLIEIKGKIQQKEQQKLRLQKIANEAVEIKKQIQQTEKMIEIHSRLKKINEMSHDDLNSISRISLEFVSIEFLFLGFKDTETSRKIKEAKEKYLKNVEILLKKSLSEFNDVKQNNSGIDYLTIRNSNVQTNSPNDFKELVRICNRLNRTDLIFDAFYSLMGNQLLKDLKHSVSVKEFCTKAQLFIASSQCLHLSVVEISKNPLGLFSAFFKLLIDEFIQTFEPCFMVSDPLQFVNDYRTVNDFTDFVLQLGCLIDDSLHELDKRWQFSVYFQLQFNQITSILEIEFGKSLEIEEMENSKRFFFNCSNGLVEALDSLWEKDLFIKNIGHKYWKGTLLVRQD
jgi:hypothetical protein